MARDLDIEPAATASIRLISGAEPVTLPEGIAPFEADFSRSGADLVLSEHGAPVLTVAGFFSSPTPVDLVAANGAVLSGDIAARLAGSGLGAQYAQSGGGSAPVAIGQVETVSGLATVQRLDGTIETLRVGSKIFQNDIISTAADGAVSVTFSDGTIFSLAQSSRMVIDNLVYDPGGSENSGGFSLLTGGFVFIAGQVAKTGDMEVTTPTATLGIRGTTVQVDIEILGGVAVVNVALNRDPDGGLGRIEMTDLDGNLIGVITSTASQWVISPIEGQTREVERITSDDASDSALLADALAAFQSAARRVEAGETFVDLGAPTDTPPPEAGPEETPPPAPDPVPDPDGPVDPGEDPLLPPVVTPPATGTDTPPPSTPETPTSPGGSLEESSAPVILPLVADDIQIAGVEDPPEGVPLAGQLTVSQGDTGTLSFTLVTEPSNGSAVVNPDGSFTYLPAADFSGTDTFTFQVSQGNGGLTATGQVTVQIAAVNDAPVIQDRAFSMNEDAALVRTLTGTDADGDPISFAIVAGQGPVNGAAVLLPDGSFSYVPNANFFGNEVITYSVSDGDGGVSTGTISVTVSAVNDAPVTPDDSATTAEDTSLSLDVLALASDIDSASLTLQSVQGAGHGTVSLVAGQAVYVPEADYTGPDSFTYTVSDGDGGVSTGTISVTVSAVNDAPVTPDDSATTAEDTSLSLDVLALASDIDSASLTLQSVQGAGHGTVSLVAGQAVYVPEADYTGPDSFTYTVSDGDGGVSTGTVSVTVSAVNDAPVTPDDSATTAEDTSLSLDVLALASDIDSASLTLQSVQGAGHGTVSLVAGQAVYVPEADYTGPDSFTYTVSDGDGGVSTGTISVTVSAVNDAPVTPDDSATTAEDTSLSLDVLALASDIDSASLTLQSVQGAGHGTVSLVAGQAVYVPEADYTGPDSFTYTVSDGDGGVSTGTISVTVSAVNDAPVTPDDSATTAEDTSLSLDVLALASDIDSASLTLQSVQGAGHGTVSLVAGQAVYVPEADYTGPDSFTYTVSDGDGGVSTGTISVTVSAVNDAPVTPDDSATTAEDTSLSLDVLALASDIDSASLTLQSVQGAGHGTVSLVAGQAVYVPEADYTGPDSFTYTVSDGDGGVSTGTISVTVSAVNDAPVTPDDSATTAEDTSLSLDVLALASDIDSASLTLQSVQGAGHGTVSLVAGQAVYVPEADYTGPDSFTYTVSDGDGGVSTGTISVTVSAVNDAPVTPDDSATTAEDTSLSLDVLALASDIDSASLTLQSVQGAGHGTVSLVAGQAVYVPEADYTGPDSFTYTVSDGDGGVSTGTVSVTVSAVNDAPVTPDDSATTAEDTSLSLDVLALASDIDSASLTLQSVQGAGHGTVSLVAGQAVYVPEADYTGPDSFTYTVSDGDGGVSTGTISVTVSAVNDAPVTPDDSATTAEDTSLSLDVLALASDIDSASLTLQSVQGAGHGTVSLVAGQAVYVPEADYTGPDSFTYTVSDGDGGVSTGTISVTVSAVNDAPVTPDDSATTAEDTSLSLDVLALASDIDSASLTLQSVQGAGHGTVSLVAGQAVYVPEADYTGPDSFTYTVSDGDGGVSTGTISVTVSAVNDAPVTPDDSATTAEDTSLSLDVLALASDIDSASLTLQSVQGAGHGTVSLVAGQAVYVPEADYTGPDSFTYTVSDGDGGVSTGTISVTVSAVNDAPVFAPSVFPALSVTEDGTATAGFNLNDSDVFTDLFTYLGGSDAAVEGEWRWAGGSEAGQLFWQGGISGSAPGGGFAPWDSPNEPNNGFGDEDYLIMYVSSGPIGMWNDIGGGLNTQIGFLVEMDAEPTALTGFVENPDNGHFYKFFENDVTWTEANALATDMGGYLANITSSDERAFVLDLAGRITPYATDPDGDVLEFSLVGGGTGTYGTASVDASGNFQYVLNTAAANVQALTASDSVTDDFTVQVSDGNGGTDTATISVGVEGAYDALAASDDLFIAQGTYYEGGYAAGYYYYGYYYPGPYQYAYTVLDPFTVNVLANDVGEGALSVDDYGYDPYDGYYGPGYFNTGATTYNYGTLSVNPDETLTYTPTTPFLGVDSFSYTALDEGGVPSFADATVVVVDSNAMTLNVLEGFNPQFGSDQSSGNAFLFGGRLETTGGLSFEVGQDGAFGAVNTSSNPDESRFDGLYGTASVTSEGAWSYVLYDDTSAVQAALLQSGTGSVEEEFDLRITDLNGSYDVATLTASVVEGIDAVADSFVVEREPYYDGYGGYNYPYFVDIDVLSNDSAGGAFTLTEFGTQFDGNYYTNDVTGAYGYAGTLEYDAVQETLRFKPMNGFFGLTSFAYTIEDQQGYTSTGTVHINVVEDQSVLLPASMTPPAFSIDADVDGTNPAGLLVASADNFFSGTLTDLSLQLFADGEDGGAFVDVFSLVDPGDIGGVDPNFEIPLAAIGIPASALGETNHFFVTATYDVPDASGTVEYKVTSVPELSKASSAQTVSGSTGPDLIFGSDFADTITGSDGADVIMGFFGADNINGGAGDDVLVYGGSSAVALQGGAGRDTLRLLFEDQGPVDLAGLNAQSIEVLDLTHAADQELTMSATDLIALFDGGDLDLNALLSAQRPALNFDPAATLTVLGGSGDTFDIDQPGGGPVLVQVESGITTADANVLNVWQLWGTGPGDVLATLGIDADMAVTGQAPS